MQTQDIYIGIEIVVGGKLILEHKYWDITEVCSSLENVLGDIAQCRQPHNPKGENATLLRCDHLTNTATCSFSEFWIHFLVIRGRK